ncbi:hypothetical protein FJY63_04625, partial [Candidatus Sumerlaeota bacterium]|nr:hypothetical protein [Candidatus Sumerlaeota bacterium]
LFTAQNVRDRLTTDAGLDEAVTWCKSTGITKVYIEVFRGGYQAEKETLARARDRFRREGFIACGAVTTTGVGKRKGGYGNVSCYTEKATAEQLEQIFRYAAGLFDVTMIDDFYFTQCECDDCKKAKGDRSWSEFRMALMSQMARDRIIAPARAVNPNAKIILKYPEWYDRFHEQGYDIVAEPAMFDITWIGTETRDPDNQRWGKKPQFGAYWLSLWTAAFSDGKLGGGWYDPYGTTPKTYVEQGRQTILGLCRESMLFCYGSLNPSPRRGGQDETGPDDVEALRRELPQHIALAEFVRGESVRGVGTYKPAHSPAGDDMYVFNFLGMLGIPMTAGLQFPAKAPSLILTRHALADPKSESEAVKAAKRGVPILLTPVLNEALSPELRKQLTAKNVRVLDLKSKDRKRSVYGVLDSVRDLMNLSREEADALRQPLLEPLGITLSAPTRVSLYLYGSKKIVLENFNDESIEAVLRVRGARSYRQALVLPPDAEPKIEARNDQARITIPPRSVVALTVE